MRTGGTDRTPDATGVAYHVEGDGTRAWTPVQGTAGRHLIQRGRLPPALRQFGSATSRTRSIAATRGDTAEKEHHLKTPAARL
jgi:hypothetical protein